MNGFFSSCHYAPSLSAFILRRTDNEVFDEQNPEGMMKIVPCEDILEADYNEVQHELTLSFREQGKILSIHLPMSPRELSPDLCVALRLVAKEEQEEYLHKVVEDYDLNYA